MSELKTNKVSPATGTALAIGDSGDTITVPSGATLDISASTLTPPATMPASSGVNLTALNASEVTSGTLPIARVADNAVTLAKLEDGTQGDVLYYGASGAPARLGFGTSGDFLKTQGTGANPVWATAGGGKVLQVLLVEDSSSQVLATDTYTDTNLSQAITPSATSSKILCIWNMQAILTDAEGYGTQLVRDVTNIWTAAIGSYTYQQAGGTIYLSVCLFHLDSPSTTSSTTYKVQVSSHSSNSITLNAGGAQTQLVLVEIGI